MARVILTDNSNTEHLIYESYSLIHQVGTNAFSSHGEETQYLDNVNIGSVRIEISDASITISTITISTVIPPAIPGTAVLKESYQASILQDKIDAINQNLEQIGAVWVAGKTPMSEYTFQEKKDGFPYLSNPVWHGYEYYAGGIFDASGGSVYPPSPYIVSSFDWKDRHGIDWNTSVKDQEASNMCGVFSTAAPIEAVINLYYNNPNIDRDLSEPAIASCLYPLSMWPQLVSTGVTEEAFFPYVTGYNNQTPCMYQPNYLNYLWKITGYATYSSNTSTIDDLQLKTDIITKGPLQFCYITHCMSLVGFGVVKEGDRLHYAAPYSYGAPIPPNHPLIGKMYWIAKDSQGPLFGDNGYIKMFIDLGTTYWFSYGSMTTPIIPAITLPTNAICTVHCTDRDNDGYAYWGIGNDGNNLAWRQQHCPSNCWNNAVPDCDDSNPLLFGYNSLYECISDCQNFTYDSNPLQITSNLPIDIKIYNKDLIIKSPAIVTVTGILYMHSQAKIVVEAGAKLIIDGGKITNPCDEMWQGIEIKGNPHLSQYQSGNHGVVELKNGAVIENAKVAISTKGDASCWPYAGTGGIIIAKNSTFRNCEYAIKMYKHKNTHPNINYPYRAKEKSYIRQCRFETSGNLLETGLKPKCFIYLDGVYGLNILGNDLVNDNFAESNQYDLGYGILSYQSSFRIDEYCMTTPCTNPVPNTFKGLHYGVYALSCGIDPITINKTVFEKNCYGVVLGGITGATITSNTFDIKQTEVSGVPCYGLYLDLCTGYHVENNDFGYLGWDTYNAIGMVVNGSGADCNEIYNNTFFRLSHGMLAQHDNRGNKKKGGLVIKCNDFSNTYNTDIAITKYSTYSGITGIARYQGDDQDVTSPTGNTFSRAPLTNSLKDINNDGQIISRYYHHEISGTTPNFYEPWAPYYIDHLKVMRFEAELLYYTKTEACPPKISSGGSSISQLYQEVAAQAININSSQLILDIWKDGGLTDLPEQVELAYPWETYVMYNTMISGSPYLSDETMIEAINNTALLPDLLLKLVLIANPQCTRSEEVMQALEDRIPQLPQSMLDEIMLGEDVPSPLEALEATVSYYTHEKQNAINLIKIEYLNDTINTYAEDSLLAVLGRDDFLNAKYEIASIYLNNNNFDDFDNIMVDIQNMLDGEEYNIEQFNEYSAYFTIVKDMLQNNKNYDDLSISQQDVLLDLADNGNYLPAAYARVILLRDNPEYEYEEPVILPEIYSPRKKNPALNSENSKDVKFKVYPNPAYDYVIIEYELRAEDKNAFVQISDNTGRIIKTITLNSSTGQKVVDCKGITSGLYNFVLKTNINVLEIKRISINN